MIDFQNSDLQNVKKEIEQITDFDETILWYGKPKTSIIFRTADIFLIPFSIFWTTIPLMGLFHSPGNNEPMLFKIIPFFFVIIGLYFFIGRFVFDIISRRHTYYGITHDRIFIKSGILREKVEMIVIKNLPKLEYVTGKNGYGSIYFVQKDGVSGVNFALRGWPGTHVPPAFEFIPEVKKVYQLIKELQSKQE